MPPIGDTLREARMRQKLDIADVEERTKIRAKYLRALENEDFSVLPGSTFVKTFLRTYAEVLGVDPHVLVEEYRATYERDDFDMQPLAAPPSGRRERELRLPRTAAPRRGTVIVVALVALLVFLLVLGVVSGGGENNGKQTAGQGTTTTPHRKHRRHRRAAPLPTFVTLKVTPAVPTYVCDDPGAHADSRAHADPARRMTPPRAGIVVTGTEVLTGRIQDRNGPWLSDRLAELGVDLAHITICGDRPGDMEAQLRFLADEGVRLIVTSGGLGPTADDLTIEVVAGFQGRSMVLDPGLEERIGR